jgi:hypothetical protein
MSIFLSSQRTTQEADKLTRDHGQGLSPHLAAEASTPWSLASQACKAMRSLLIPL